MQRILDRAEAEAVYDSGREACVDTELTLTLKLPAAALDALKRGATESVTLTLTGSNAYGSSKATAKINRLHGVN